MSLVVFTSAVGLLTSPNTIPLLNAFMSIFFVTLGAGAAGALNMWYESDLDALMSRTCLRPIPTGKIKKLIDMKVGVSNSPEGDAYSLASSVGGKLARLYSEYGYYLKALEKEKEDKIKYGTTDFARSEVEQQAKDFQSYWRDIMQFKL